MHQYKINKSIISCYFAQPVTPVSNKNLQPPAPTKQYLISPPCSPPINWQQADESEPHIFNHDLLAALAILNPGEVHELHAASETQPGILVHTAIVNQDDLNAAAAAAGTKEETVIVDDGGSDDDKKVKAGITPTRCPERT